jgi:hypothetical protein
MPPPSCANSATKAGAKAIANYQKGDLLGWSTKEA